MAIVKLIDEIIKAEYKLPGVTCVSEENTDINGVPFKMERPIENKQGLSSILCRFDTNPAVLFPYFEKGHDLRRMCDYVLFAERKDNDTEWCLLIELKKGKEPAREQLAAGEAFIKFLLTTAERVGKDILIGSVQFRKIRVAENAHLKASLRAAIPEYDQNRYCNLLTDALQLRHLLR